MSLFLVKSWWAWCVVRSVRAGLLHPLRPAGHDVLGELLAGPQRGAGQDNPGDLHLAHTDYHHQEHGLWWSTQGDIVVNISNRTCIWLKYTKNRLTMSSSLTSGSLSAPSLFSSHCLSLPLLTPFGGGSMLKYQKYIILQPSSHTSRDTIRMNKISHKSIIREGIKEFKRTAFSTPTISRRNSLDARRQSYEKENENQLTISSLVSKHRRNSTFELFSGGFL